MNDVWILSQKFLLSLREKDVFYLGKRKFEVGMVNDHKISLLINGKPFLIHKKHCDEFFYLHSRGIKIKNRNYPLVDQLIRDIEGYIVYLNHVHFLEEKEKKFKNILDRI